MATSQHIDRAKFLILLRLQWPASIIASTESASHDHDFELSWNSITEGLS